MRAQQIEFVNFQTIFLMQDIQRHKGHTEVVHIAGHQKLVGINWLTFDFVHQ